jgi:hypothetical protein
MANPVNKLLISGAVLLLLGLYFLLEGGTLTLAFSIPIIIAAVIVLGTSFKAETLPAERPIGVIVAGYIFLFGSIALGLRGYMQGILSGVGMAGLNWEPSAYFKWTLMLTAVFAFAGLFLSIIVIRGVSSKYVWYALMAYWSSFLIFSLARDLSNLENVVRNAGSSVFYILVLPPYVYGITCATYFLTNKPRKYFHIN